jgi:hypothetical protein
MIDVLKSVMGIEIVPDKSHCLYQHFEDYERSRGVLLQLTNIPESVLELARYGFYLHYFRDQWKDPKVLAHLRTRLMPKYRSSVGCSSISRSSVYGVFFELHSARHFTYRHREVKWLQNLSNQSEFDLEATTSSGCMVFVECTRRQEKQARVSNHRLLIDDVDSSVRGKSDKAAFATNGAWVCVLIPELVSWSVWPYRAELAESTRKCFNHRHGNHLLGVSVISPRVPQERRTGSYTVHEFEATVWSLPNKRATAHIPADFFPGLD